VHVREGGEVILDERSEDEALRLAATIEGVRQRSDGRQCRPRFPAPIVEGVAPARAADETPGSADPGVRP
jgi:hypothetical protein